ncbi:MAG: hypothetical protein Q9160_007640 [Pyrenula sp. 1 TL-2023]
MSTSGKTQRKSASETAPSLSVSTSPASNAQVDGPKSNNRKKVSVACTACKHQCVFVHESDGRRSTQIKRKLEEFERDSDLLHQLLETIRHSQDTNVAQIVSLIRSNASLNEISLCVQQQRNDDYQSRQRRSPEASQLDCKIDDLRKSKPEQFEPTLHRPSHAYRKTGVARLADCPPYQVPASPWTTVTSDDGLVSHLISVWLTWDKPLHNVVDEGLFLRDMQAAELGANFCSPFLVNSVLAWSCPYSDYEETKTQRGTTSKLMDDFIDEAKKLLEEEDGKPSIPTTQGLGLLYMALCATGHDRVGYQYMKQARLMCEDLSNVAVLGQDAIKSPAVEKEFSEAIDYTCWGVFNITTLASLAWMKPQQMEVPDRQKPRISDSAGDAGDWTPYPHKGPRISSYSRELMWYKCQLSVFSKEATHLLFGKENTGLVTRRSLEAGAFSLLDRLRSWRNSLPDHLEPKQGSPPSVFLHQSYYQTIVLTILSALKQSCEGASSIVVDQARKLCENAALEVRHLCDLYHVSWGTETLNLFLVQPITLSLYTLMDRLDESPEFCSPTIDLCCMFRAVSRRWTIAMNVLRMVQLSAKDRGIKLPSETNRLFEEFETEDWLEQETKRVVSIYPDALSATFKNVTSLDSDSKGKGQRHVRNMTEFLALMDDLRLSDERDDRQADL